MIKVGLNGDVAGYNDKYDKMTAEILEKTGYTVIVAGNDEATGNKLAEDINYVKACVPDVKTIYYVGYSNGAVVGAQYGYLYPEIKRMLLINGPLFVDWYKIKKGCEQFKGDKITFVYGNKDQSYKWTELVTLIKSSCETEFYIIEGADHLFKGMEEEFVNLPLRYLFNRDSH